MNISPNIRLIGIIIGVMLLTIGMGVAFMLILDFDGIEFNGDSYVYILNARHFSNSIRHGNLPTPTYWPYGYPALLSAISKFGYVTFETGRWVNIIFGGLLAATFCYAFFPISSIKKIPFEQSWPIILSAGILPLGHSFFLKYQLVLMSDMSAIFWSTLSIVLCWQWRTSNNILYIALAGLTLGLSVLTRYVNALMLIPSLIVLFSAIDFNQNDRVRKNIMAIFLYGVLALLIFLPQLSITLQNTSSSLGNGLLHDWSIKNFFTLTHESIDGHQPAKVPSVVYYFALPFRWQGFTPLGLVLVWFGVRYSIRELPKWFWRSMFAWYASSYVLLCGIPLQNGRIGFPLFIPVLFWIVLGLMDCKDRWESHFNKTLLLTFFIWCLSFTFSAKAIVDFIHTKNELKQTAETIVQIIPKESTVISTSLFAVYNTYPMEVKQLSIYEMSIQDAEQLFKNNNQVFLAIDENHFIPQWGNYPPGKCYGWMMKHYDCRIIRVIHEYTLYEVKPLTKN